MDIKVDTNTGKILVKVQGVTTKGGKSTVVFRVSDPDALALSLSNAGRLSRKVEKTNTWNDPMRKERALAGYR